MVITWFNLNVLKPYYILGTVLGSIHFRKFGQRKKKIVKSSENHTWYLHKGSVKDHERNGCKLCQTEGRCEAHGRGHCCPCEWHRAERHRQLVAVENNIKKWAVFFFLIHSFGPWPVYTPMAELVPCNLPPYLNE